MFAAFTAILDDLAGEEILALLNEHVEEMRRVSPPGSSHALDLDGLRHDAVRFWSFWNGDHLVGCGALKAIDSDKAEIKSMRLAHIMRGQGLASRILEHLLADARAQGYHSVWLETGSYEFFTSARRLYESAGFAYCPPFADYMEDPASVFMTRIL